MSGNRSRQNFLPSLIESCQETDETWSKNEKDGIKIRSYSTNGFDGSGKYYTVDLGGSPNKILVYHFDSDTQALKANLINLKILNFHLYTRIVYDPFTTRWFCISMEFDEQQIVQIESGCLGKHLGTSVTLPLKAEQKSDRGCWDAAASRRPGRC